jgi:hypothetical protein
VLVLQGQLATYIYMKGARPNVDIFDKAHPTLFEPLKKLLVWCWATERESGSKAHLPFDATNRPTARQILDKLEEFERHVQEVCRTQENGGASSGGGDDVVRLSLDGDYDFERFFHVHFGRKCTRLKT